MNSNSYKKAQWRRHFWIISVMLKFHKIVHNKKNQPLDLFQNIVLFGSFFKITI